MGEQIAGVAVPALRVAVVVHLYYPHMWPEFSAMIGNVPEPFELFVTLAEGSTAGAAVRRDYPRAIVRHVPNVGRDVAPFLALLPELQRFDVVCKVHTKRDTPRHRAWRIEALRSMLGSPAIVGRILAAFAADPQIMMAGSRELLVDAAAHPSRTADLPITLGNKPDRYGFFAGTMFWARPSVFADFPERVPQALFTAHLDTDGHAEHAVERWFGARVAALGGKIALTSPTDELGMDVRPATDPRIDDFNPVKLKLTEAYAAYPVDWYKPAAEQRTVAPHPTIAALYEAHDGKASDKWASYLPHYERVFAPYRNIIVNVLEIGVQNGGSLEILARYFPYAGTIIGNDIDPGCGTLNFSDPRICVIVGNATARETQRQIAIQSPRLDLVIDDGSHRSADIIRAFATYFAMLEDGGTYIIEDLHCSYWQEYDGGLYHRLSPIGFFAALADAINHEHWGLNRPAGSRLSRFIREYELRLPDSVLTHIHSIEFANSMCIIRKQAPADNVLGQRVRGGSEQAVVNTAALAGTYSVAPNQSRNRYSNPSQPQPKLVQYAWKLERLRRRLTTRLKRRRKARPRPAPSAET